MAQIKYSPILGIPIVPKPAGTTPATNLQPFALNASSNKPPPNIPQMAINSLAFRKKKQSKEQQAKFDNSGDAESDDSDNDEDLFNDGQAQVAGVEKKEEL